VAGSLYFQAWKIFFDTFFLTFSSKKNAYVNTDGENGVTRFCPGEIPRSGFNSLS